MIDLKSVRVLSMLALSLITLPLSPAYSAKLVTLTHVHGLSYSTDGMKIFIPSHDGLAIYSQGKWSKAPGPTHDYMGFSATRQFFYSSGHPARESGLVNPFGLIKSKDGGMTWEHLGLKGESDFHTLATGYETNVVYVFNHRPNSRMKQAGLYYTKDDGVRWSFAKQQGAADPFKLAVHPSQPNIIAMGTKLGVFLSQDYGDTFQHIVGAMEVHSTFFELDGQYLWFGGFDGKPSLTRLNWKTSKKESISLPSSIVRDAVTYIAQNPVKLQEFTITTLHKDVYLSSDQGKAWKQIANKGTTL